MWVDCVWEMYSLPLTTHCFYSLGYSYKSLHSSDSWAGTMFPKAVLFSLLSLVLIVSATGLECMIYVSSSSIEQNMHLTWDHCQWSHVKCIICHYLMLLGRNPLLTRGQEVCLFVCLCSSCVIGTNVAQSNIIIALWAWSGFAPSMFYILLVLCTHFVTSVLVLH